MTLVLKSVSKYMLLLGLALGFFAALNIMFGFNVDAQNTGAAREGLGLAGGESAGDAEASLGTIIQTIIDILSIIVGAISVIMIIIGGLKYVVSAGDSSGIQSAKNTIIYAIVGLVIVIFAQTIVRFVIDRIDTPAPAVEAEADAEAAP